MPIELSHAEVETQATIRNLNERAEQGRIEHQEQAHELKQTRQAAFNAAAASHGVAAAPNEDAPLSEDQGYSQEEIEAGERFNAAKTGKQPKAKGKVNEAKPAATEAKPEAATTDKKDPLLPKKILGLEEEPNLEEAKPDPFAEELPASASERMKTAWETAKTAHQALTSKLDTTSKELESARELISRYEADEKASGTVDGPEAQAELNDALAEAETEAAKILAPFQEVDGDDQWNARIPELKAQARFYFEGKASTRELADASYLAAAARPLYEMNAHLIQKLNSAYTTIRKLHAAQPTAGNVGNGQFPKSPKDESSMSEAELKEVRAADFESAAAGLRNGWH